MTRKLAPILAGVALAGGLAFGGASLASAQDSSPSTTQPSTESTQPTAPDSGRPAHRDGTCPDKAGDRSGNTSPESSASSES